MAKGLIVVEGHGEDGAAPNLVTRLWSDLQLPFVVWDPRPIRWNKLTSAAGVAQLCEILRNKREHDRVLVLRDDEDGCPRDSGPELASWLRQARLPYPAAAVMMYREFETLFLASLPSLAGKPLVDPNGIQRPGIVSGASYSGNPEVRRDAKGEVSHFMTDGRRYKPTTDQLALTRHLDFELLRQSTVACFGTLERALRFLANAKPGEAYP